MRSLAVTGLLMMSFGLAVAQEAARAMWLHEATVAFLDTLSAEQRAKAVFPFEDEERLNWHYFPKDRAGISIKELNIEQRDALAGLIEVALSEKGYSKVEAIRELETVLFDLSGGKDQARDPERYYLSVFGEPSAEGDWGLRYEGHHLSLNWTILGGIIESFSPQFLGTNPGEVREGVHNGMRALAEEEGLARELVKSFSAEQRVQAVASDIAPPEILTGADREAKFQDAAGLRYADMTEAQRGLFMRLIAVFAGVQADAVASETMRHVTEDGLDEVRFVWMGGIEKGEGHYYRIQGGAFLVEYDNTQNQANHVHTVWREPQGDFGHDWLQEHYAAHANDPAHGHDRTTQTR